MVVKIKTKDPFGNDITVQGHGGKRRISGSTKIANPEATSARLNNPVLRINRAFVTAVAKLVSAACVQSGSLINGKLTPPSYLVQYLRDVTRNNQEELKSGKFTKSSLIAKIRELSGILPFYLSIVDDSAFDAAYRKKKKYLEAHGKAIEKIEKLKKQRDEYLDKVFTLMRIMARELTPEQIITIKAVAGWETGEEALRKVLEEYGKVSAPARARAAPARAPAAAVVEREEGRVVVRVRDDEDMYLI